VEANACVPHVYGVERYGAHRIHISEVNHVVEADEPLMELPAPEPTEIESRMADHVAELVEDGATIQLGFGGLPNTIAKLLRDKKDLGVHSEMMGDGVLDLIECGAVTNAVKTDHRGLSISTFVLGSKKLYDWVERNDEFRLLPVLEVNHPAIVARQHKMTAINNALSVDFRGQVAVHAIGAEVYSGLGGIFEFCIGPMMSEGGKSILCLRSATDLPTGRVSNIVPRFPEGAAVTIPDHCVDWVVTEWGAAQLRWQTLVCTG
jgi:4-hydroxybutyrate CoA-transferase